MFSLAQPSWLGRITGRPSVETHVAETRIFARVDGAAQWLAYQMRVGAPSDVAMILPLPVVPGSGDEAVAFVDLSAYDKLFDDLEWLFPGDRSLEATALGQGAPRGKAPKLVVHDVGSFEASYVPTRADFSRLDRRFRLPEAVWDALPRYADWGFAVFKLKKGRAKRIHPMAFRFPTRDPARIFFPTVHVHNGELDATASFDHALYFQPPILGSSDIRSDAAARAWVDSTRARGLVDADSYVGKRVISGTHDNEDTWIDLAARAP
jgi:hypothetical protein